MRDKSNWYTLDELAKLEESSRSTLLRRMKVLNFPYVKVGSRILIRCADYEALAKEAKKSRRLLERKQKELAKSGARIKEMQEKIRQIKQRIKMLKEACHLRKGAASHEEEY